MQSVNNSQTPQKLSGTKDVHFFSVGNLNGRTLVIYMKKKNVRIVVRKLLVLHLTLPASWIPCSECLSL
jgi:hypothetical protein